MIHLPDITMVYVLAAFVATYWILRRYLFGPLGEILDERERDAETAAKIHAESLDRLSQTVARAEQDLSNARREALKQREALRAEGRAELERQIAQAQASAQAAIEKANQEIAAESQRLSQNLPQDSRRLARELAEKILGRRLVA
ncbi:MAG TPA: ATP synthase F0 subunit B [Thermoanaerobaculia bacterium]|nr:ATP synthase F0 subunit B [Thermoanaerobaculia bacterium]